MKNEFENNTFGIPITKACIGGIEFNVCRTFLPSKVAYKYIVPKETLCSETYAKAIYSYGQYGNEGFKDNLARFVIKKE